MIDIDHGNSSDAPLASPPSTQRNPSRDGWGCLVFGPSLLRLDTAAGPVRIRKARMGAIWDNCCLKSRPCNWVCGW